MTEKATSSTIDMTNIDKKHFNPDNIIEVDISNVRTNTWNPKEANTPEYSKVKKSVEINGLKGFIAVRYNPNGKTDYEILDGHQRYTAATELGFKKIYVYNEGKVSDKKAREYTIWWQQQVPFEKVQEAQLVTELIKEYADTESLPYSDAEIEQMKIMTEFSFEEYDENADSEKDTMYKLTFVFPDQDEANMVADYFNRADSSREDLLIALLRQQLKLN